MLEVTIEGFQSLRKPGTVKVDGFTTITGESHLGKSALIRALEAASENRKGTEFVTTGENVCRVKVQYPDLTVVWDKSVKGSSQYSVGGIIHSKTGRETLSEVANGLGIHTITTLDGNTHTPQIQGQHDSPFLLSKEYSPSAVSELIGSNPDVAKLSKSIRLIRADLKTCQAAAATKGEIHRKQQIRVDSLEFGQKAMKASNKTFDVRILAVEEDQVKMTNLIEVVGGFRDSSIKTELFRPLDHLTEPSAPNSSLVESLQNLAWIYSETVVATNLQIPEVISPLRMDSKRLVSLGTLEAEIRRFPPIPESIPIEIPTPGISSETLEVMDQLISAKRVKDLLESVPQVLSQVILPNRARDLNSVREEISKTIVVRNLAIPTTLGTQVDLGPITELRSLMVELLQLRSNLSSLLGSLRLLDDELVEAETDIRDLRAEAVSSGTCLVCGR